MSKTPVQTQGSRPVRAGSAGSKGGLSVNVIETAGKTDACKSLGIDKLTEHLKNIAGVLDNKVTDGPLWDAVNRALVDINPSKHPDALKLLDTCATAVFKGRPKLSYVRQLISKEQFAGLFHDFSDLGLEKVVTELPATEVSVPKAETTKINNSLAWISRAIEWVIQGFNDGSSPEQKPLDRLSSLVKALVNKNHNEKTTEQKLLPSQNLLISFVIMWAIKMGETPDFARGVLSVVLPQMKTPQNSQWIEPIIHWIDEQGKQKPTN